MDTIRATVNPRLLAKASRLFTGTRTGRIVEILQNCRRAGATQVEITNHDGVVTVQDNGHGVTDFRALLDLGGSGWEESFEQSEDPAGVGLFCLAPQELCIRSLGGAACIAGDGWTGAPVAVRPAEEPIHGTRLQFHDEPWDHEIVEPLAVFTGMLVIVDGRACAREPFISEHATHYPELGCRIEVRQTDALGRWQRHVPDPCNGRDNVLVNFHGQVVSTSLHPVHEPHLWYLVDLDGQPTGIRLMLPARTRIVQNPAFDRLKAALEREAYLYLRKRGHHRLPYSQYLRARELGVELPEAVPTYEVGLLGGCNAPDPVEVRMPDGFPLARCCRFDPHAPGMAETDETNAHLLAALGQFSEPFVPVRIHQDYDGYSWADLPRIVKVEVQVGKTFGTDYLWSGAITCVDALRITVQTVDGRTYSSPVCLARTDCRDSALGSGEDHVVVTPDAEDRLAPEDIWYHVGGMWDEGDTYDTQAWQFTEELERFWMKLKGPDEQRRQRIVASLDGMEPAWSAVHVTPDGQVRIEQADGSTKTIDPPAGTPAA